MSKQELEDAARASRFLALQLRDPAVAALAVEPDPDLARNIVETLDDEVRAANG